MLHVSQVDRLTKNVSFGSTVVSQFTSTDTVFVVCPVAKFSVQEFDK